MRKNKAKQMKKGRWVVSEEEIERMRKVMERGKKGAKFRGRRNEG
jgi:hypothetical protein